MTKILGNVSAPEGEQEICVNCGLCCDATLFLHATLQPGERGHLPEKIEEAGSTGDGGDYFLLPCGYFSGACTIYDCQRADVCSTFRCRLLKVFAGGGISQADALRTVREAVAMRDAVLAEYHRVTGRDAVAGFRRMIIDLGAAMKGLKDSGASAVVPAGGAVAGDAMDGVTLARDYEMLLVRCNILEALLIRFFMSDEEFEKYIMR